MTVPLDSPKTYGLADAVAAFGVFHSQSGTAGLMLRNWGVPKVNSLNFPLGNQHYEGSFFLPCILITICEPLSVIIAYEQRRGSEYGTEGNPPCPFEQFCLGWLALYDWIEEAKLRGIYSERVTIICMDRTRQPDPCTPKRHDSNFPQQLEDLQAIVANKNYAALMNYEHIARYVEWMRAHREIFEFVDGVGGYGSGWWLNS